LNSPLTNLLPRVATRDVVLPSGFVIPKGTHIDIDVTSTHLSENNWENASEFIPERYLDGEDGTSHKKGIKWAPFGYGSHHCLGMNFSYAEQRVFLSMLCK
jgi:cytochrome P450